MLTLGVIPRRILSLSALLAIAAAFLIGAMASDAVAVTCDRNNQTVTVTLGAGQDATIRRSAASITVAPGGCTGNPTVNNTDKVNVTAAGGAETFTIDFSSGLFRPGATNEAQGDSEIEIDVAMGDGEDSLIITGRAKDDNFVSGAAGINYNGDNDADITRQNVQNITLNGAGGNDTISGAGGSGTGAAMGGGITLNGGAGNDTERGGEGNDTFVQSADPNGSDVLDGGGGTDAVNYNNRTAAVSVTLDGVADDGASGEGDNARADIEVARTGAGADTLTGNASNNTLNGGEGGDIINGGDGNDSLVGAAGSDVLNGGNGIDTASYGGRTAPINVTIDGVANDGESGENDNVGTDVEEVDGGSGADTITGGAGNETLRGNDGDDVLAGAGGSDLLIGGAGTDTATYSERSESVSVTLDGGANDGVAGEADNVAVDVENVIGGNAGDTLSGNGASNVLSGGPGGDRLNGGDGNDVENGGDGKDRFLQGAATNGADQLNGGPEDDTVSYASRVETITVTLEGNANDGAPNEGDDVGAGVENATTGSGDDHVAGNASPNKLTGGRGKDSISGAVSSDNLSGGKGNDDVGGGDGDDVISGGQGDDKLRGKAQGDDVSGGSGADRLEGGSGGDDLKGKNGNDRLLGGSGNDSLNGGDGRDDCATGPDGGSKTNCEK
jgi:Ca2+-binding RTX toxin-like protein